VIAVSSCLRCGLVVCAWLLASCATSPDTQTQPAQGDVAMLDASWKAASHATHPAVSDLLQQADALIAAGQYDQASDKVERALRIAPDHAPSWSRLALLALDEGQPMRAIRMAQKSNSYAANASRLLLQNWEYIRQANAMMQNEQGVEQAERSIRQLQAAH
jgi:tetratricopeptide (TPR) repeat protein